MQRGQVAPIGSLALAVTLAVGAVLVAPDAHATQPDQFGPVVQGPPLSTGPN